jgi:hypothetical protein
MASRILHAGPALVPAVHVAVPCIDMANHSSTAANAVVRLMHQSDEVPDAARDDTAAAAAGPSSSSSSACFQLVAGEPLHKYVVIHVTWQIVCCMRRRSLCLLCKQPCVLLQHL